MPDSTAKVAEGARGRTFITRWRERLRYGLLVQELLDRLNRWGILYYPYYVMREEVAAAPAEPMPPRITFAEIESDKARLIAALPCRPFSLEYVVRRMQDAKCFAAFRDGELVGYTWCYYSHVPAASGRDVLFELDDNSAYVFDMYVARLHRGHRIAVALRRWTNSELARRGRREIFSTTLAHNSSAMRFKERLAAAPIEKRLGYGVKHVFGRDVRVKSFVEGPLPTEPSIALRHWARTARGVT